MTIRNELADYDHFIRIQFVEMLEMIGRIAEVKYREHEEESLPLHEKVILVLEIILALIGKQYTPVKIDDESQSESDDDY